jgi:ABC-2 type transport system permease protein
MVGFWLTEIGFFFEAVRIILITASGGIFPLSVFGPAGERALKMLPFYYTIQFPTELLCGRMAPVDAATGFVSAGAWMVVLFAAGRVLWNVGVRRFAAVGS